MTTINTIEDLARILTEQPTWAQALRSLLLTEEMLELPTRFDQFIQANQESVQALKEAIQANQGPAESLLTLKEAVQALQESNRLTNQRLNAIEGKLGNLEGGQYERNVRTKALARAQIVMGLNVPYVALNQDGLTDPRLTGAIARAIEDETLTPVEAADLFETDIIISAQDNRHAAVEVSLTADRSDLNRAKTRAGFLATVTGGAATPVVITARLSYTQKLEAQEEGVTVFIIPHP